MRHDPFGTRLRHGLIACACAARSLALGSAGAAKAQQAEDDEDTFEQSIIKNILGGLGVDVGRHGHRVPRAFAAGDPADASTCRRRSRPARRRAIRPGRASRRARRPPCRRSRRCDATPEDPGTSSRLTPDEMRRGTNPRAQRVTDPSKSGSQEDIDIGRPLRPNELGSSSIFNWRALTGSYANETAKFDGEPTRGPLTQPPPGYQTPSANQPYGVGSDTGRRLEDSDRSLAGRREYPTIDRYRGATIGSPCARHRP